MPAALSLEHISKRFGAVAALEDVSLQIERGEIFALVGENGAGKTTLMNVVYGLYKPDRGSVQVFERAEIIDSPAKAISLGVGMVHQHFMLVPPLTVAENVVLGREPKRWGLLDRREAVARVKAVADQFGFEVDPHVRVEQIGVGMQQRVEIIKALYRGAQLLILDEPTANLTPQEADDLYRVVRGLAQAGKTVIFISHKLREVLAVAHRIGVMRRGRLVSVVKAADTNATALSELMVGREVAGMERGPAAAPPAGEPLLRVGAVSALNDRGRPALSEVSFELRAGEILAVAGVDGNGQAELAEVLTGLRRTSAGSLSVGGQELAGQGPHLFREAGVAHVPSDRQQRGLCLPMRVDENLSLGRHAREPFASGAFIDRAGRAQAAARLCSEYDIRPPDPALAARALSGGNQQKVIVAREIDAGPKVLVVVQPTRGLDVGAISTVHGRLRRERDRGRAVLLISLDLDEVLALGDRILVLYGGQVMGIVPGEGADEKALGRMMLGQRSEAAEAPRA
ncbi:MAG: ABC transporter ATP-binding protein [Deltaproteobacteria bacterium]|nr:ABC transporter ATP-binding protein [Deltaproteobacteria bacterium]